MDNFGIYVIVSHPVLPYTAIARICVEEEIKVLQLREKKLSEEQIISIGKEMLQITRGTGTKLVINDRPDLAALIGADGYHLGQDDMTLQEARSIYPAATITGLSTHNISQMKASLKHEPDYIGFGPVYATPTKEMPDPVTGLGLLKEALSLSDRPVVAIGGIDESNINHVLQAGAKNVALVRYFMQSYSLQHRIKKIKEICKDHRR